MDHIYRNSILRKSRWVKICILCVEIQKVIPIQTHSSVENVFLLVHLHHSEWDQSGLEANTWGSTRQLWWEADRAIAAVQKQIPKKGTLLGVLIVCIAHKESRIWTSVVKYPMSREDFCLFVCVLFRQYLHIPTSDSLKSLLCLG